MKKNLLYAKSVERSLKQLITESTDFAQGRAGLQIGEKAVQMMKQENANGAAMSSQQTNIQKRKPAAAVAVISSVGIKAIRKVGRADVYNMEVEDNHNFVIEGGLIVHNCMDSMRYFVRTKHIAREKTMYKSIFGVMY